MKVVSYSDARNNLKDIIDCAIDDADIAVINRRDGQNAVLMGQDHYDSLMETLYLLSSPANASRLMESVKQARLSNTTQHDLIED